MATTVSQYQQGAFSSPTNGTLSDASVVLSNDNTLRATYNSHDAEAGLHFQSSVAASRPAAGTAGRKWIDSDTLRVYYDNGSSWDEIAYTRTAAANTFTASQTISSGSSQALVVTSTNADQVLFRYDSSNYLKFSISSAGAVTFDAVGASAGFAFSDAVAVTGTVSATTGMSISAGALAVTRTNTQLSLNYDGSNTVNFTCGSSGDLAIAPGGGDTSITGTLSATGDLTVNSGSTPATSGAVRLPNNTMLAWRNGTNSADLTMLMTAGDLLILSTPFQATTLRATGDNGGAASSNALSNVSDTSANSSGTGTIKFKGATNRDSTGFIKIYVGTTAYYVPFFDAITG